MRIGMNLHLASGLFRVLRLLDMMGTIIIYICQNGTMARFTLGGTQPRILTMDMLVLELRLLNQ